MTLEPLLSADPAIRAHAITALISIPLGLVQIVGVKGNLAHRTLGTAWVGLMALVAGSSLFIYDERPFGEPFWTGYSWIHGLTAFTIVMLLIGIREVRRPGPEMKAHGRGFIFLFVGGLVITGGFTLLPGRVMHAVVFGAP
ncbi:MAG: DUF2306 domain-containing protein [Pseudomonadota bacterium]